VSRSRKLVPVEELVDLASLETGGGAPSPRELRRALPRGWALADDGRHAYRDARLLFREGWILILGLVVFGSAAGAFLWGALPRGTRGILRFALLVGVVLVVGGLVGPRITRALHRPSRAASTGDSRRR
jgi:hypothetical protein